MKKEKITIDFNKPMKEAQVKSQVWNNGALCNLADREKEQSASKSSSKLEKILKAEPREAREAVLKAMEEDEELDEEAQE